MPYIHIYIYTCIVFCRTIPTLQKEYHSLHPHKETSKAIATNPGAKKIAAVKARPPQLEFYKLSPESLTK